jgi:hypothetical protein
MLERSALRAIEVRGAEAGANAAADPTRARKITDFMVV